MCRNAELNRKCCTFLNRPIKNKCPMIMDGCEILPEFHDNFKVFLKQIKLLDI